ncbi:fumarylacetoacetate hydrolase family protein [Actinocorallia sp. A-T 12471]|uniref:fumarylacetoacetate hydrolase family protein n=1 Tax=Actinocorallia sp. A-T 12471 TaxID=3089813 RepID=UPI0029D1C2FF|nr:fumarylacetoacetate hydrolase family protein [Actinocorallia sp. A-T 12471]MDX6741558.1 fumarylacetoacetate hydrolase family protein [Actinocorallia sp. A-T 12471]
MKYVSFRDADGVAALARVEAGLAHRLVGLTAVDAAISPEALRDAEAEPVGVPVDDLRLLPVVSRPGKIFCVGLNYRAHVEESNRELPTYPVLFPKFASNLIAHGDAIVLPPESHKVDYEAELAVVIGRGGRRIARDDAFDHVLGYTICNDVTMRDFQYKTHQWTQGKAWDDATPLGPALVTPDEVDPGKLDITFRRNGVELQSSTTALMIFDVPELISTISTFTRLEPGDVILTGTPSGVGFRRDPQVFLTDGDVVEVEISGLGVLRNTVRAEA